MTMARPAAMRSMVPSIQLIMRTAEDDNVGATGADTLTCASILCSLPALVFDHARPLAAIRFEHFEPSRVRFFRARDSAGYAASSVWRNGNHPCFCGCRSSQTIGLMPTEWHRNRRQSSSIMVVVTVSANTTLQPSSANFCKKFRLN